jgi:hypothetical protein
MPSLRMWNFCFSARSDRAVPLKRCFVDQDHRGAAPSIGDLAAGRGRYVRALRRELGRGRQFGKGRIHSTQYFVSAQSIYPVTGWKSAKNG